MNESTRMMLESAERLLRDACTKAVVDAAEAGQFPEALWTELEALGLPNACLGEGQGGVGLPLAEGFTLLRLAGRYAMPLPLAETLLGRALIGAEGPAEALTGVLSIALPSSRGGYEPVPFAPWAQWVLVAREEADGALTLHCVSAKALTFGDARLGSPRLQA
jgi:Acyl-CoA dehydrogenase, N-terminal domain.